MRNAFPLQVKSKNFPKMCGNLSQKEKGPEIFSRILLCQFFHATFLAANPPPAIWHHHKTNSNARKNNELTRSTQMIGYSCRFIVLQSLSGSNELQAFLRRSSLTGGRLLGVAMGTRALSLNFDQFPKFILQKFTRSSIKSS